MFEYDRSGIARASSGPADDAYTVTPADSDLTLPLRALYVTGAGNLVVTTTSGNSRTIAVPANFMFECGVTRVAAATTATGIIGYV